MEQLSRAKINIMGLQEVRWYDSGELSLGDYTYYNIHWSGPHALVYACFRPVHTRQQSCRKPQQIVAENGNKLLPETVTLTNAATTMLPFRATICCLVWTGLYGV